MADRIVILNGAAIDQVGPPEDVYNAPASPFVARFMGAENVIDAQCTDDGWRRLRFCLVLRTNLRACAGQLR